MPVTFIVMLLICAMGMLGSMGAEAMTLTVPINPLHCATPAVEIVTVMGADVEAMGIIGLEVIGIPSDHITGVAAFMGAMLKFPIAEN